MDKAARELQQSLAKFLHSLEWLEVNGLLLFCSKIYVPDLCNLYCCIVSLHYNTKIAGYTGYWKTLELESWSY